MTNKHSKAGMPRALKITLIVLAVLLALILLLGGIYFALYWQGRNALLDREPVITPPTDIVEGIEGIEDEGKTVTYQGKTYRFNESVVSLLFMGVDKHAIHEQEGYGENGQADSLFLATINTATGAVKILPLSRETMVDVNLYAVDGTFMGTKKTQLCLAYAYAKDGEDGCENTLRSATRLLYGMPIDGYLALDMEGVKALTDAVGGVNVVALESIYDVGAPVYFVEGQPTTLTSANVLPYIQERGQDNDANNRRMQRQKQFLDEFIRVAVEAVKKDFTKVETYYSAAEPYSVSDLTLSKVTYLATAYLNGGNRSIEYLSVPGESKLGNDEHVEFYPDETSLYEAILDAFYIVEE